MINEPAPTDVWIETEDGRRLPLRGNLRLGRASDNHVVVDGPKASRHHAAIHVQDDMEYWLIDLGSRNGTFRNDQRLLRPTRLSDGDRITLAGAHFRFRQCGARPAGQSTSLAGKATVIDFKDLNVWLLIVDMESFTQLSRELPPDKLAISVGRWIQEGQRLIEKAGGRITRFLGDGFLACWESSADKTPSVVEALLAFRALREAGTVKFRVVVHHGVVTFGGGVQFGEESMIGSELNYVFRLEKLASELGLTYCLSTTAQQKLEARLRLELVAGEYALKGYPGRHRCFTIRWP